MRSKLWRVCALLVVLTLLVPSAALAEPTIDQPPPPLPQAREPEAVSPGGKGAQADPMSKLDSELRALAAEGGEEPVLVYILAEPGADLSRVAEVTETRPFPDGELIVARVEPAMIAKLASHPGVLAAEAFHAIEAPIPLTPGGEEAERPTREQVREARKEARKKIAELRKNGLEGAALPEAKMPGGAAPTGAEGAASPEDWFGVGVVGAPEAWDKGYTGEGVNIAILDSGVDFGHPDLEGKQAYYEDGPYAGWPIALDPRSMRSYYYYGYTSWDNYFYGGDYSWYADVPNVLHCTDGMTTTFFFDRFEYTIDDDIAAKSKSGEIRWGVHPDVQLPGYVAPFFEWMPFILLDTDVAGEYDTVVADLNYDRWFDEYDDTAVLGTDDPVLSQDLGTYVYTDTYVLTGTQWIPYIGAPPTWWGPPIQAMAPLTLPTGSWVFALNHNSMDYPEATDGADGIADVSGGMVYFVADGERPIPGMDYLYAGIGPAGNTPIPLNGQLVAFMLGSDYVAGYDHGTLCASAAAADGAIKGYFSSGLGTEWVQYDPEDWSNMFNADDVSEYMPWLKGADEGTVQGPAPGASIIAVGACYDTVNGMQGFYDAYTFLAYGVDGEPESGDEFVDIVSISYGDGTVHEDGWDFESRLLSYYNQNFLKQTTFHASSGNGGHGFGTINSPQGNTTVSVGASTQYGASTVFGSALALDQINEGEVQPFSGRGPDAMGRPDPDVVANGAWGAGDTPLNMAGFYNTYFGGGWFPGDGHNAWYEWGGTSRSAPEAAGVTALLYQAYEEATGEFPDFDTARQILMSGADDLNHDVLMQGAGRVNADRATDVAGWLDGVYVSPSLLAAGEYDGSHYESFANVLYPGDTWEQTFTVYNADDAATTVTIDDEVLLQTDVLTYSVVVSPYMGMEDPYPDTYYYYANYFVGADPTTTTHGPDLAIPVPPGADLMQVQMVVPFELFDFAYNDPDPMSVSYNQDERWSLTVYDWEDRNGDGKLWEDANGDGIVNPQVYGPPEAVDVSYLWPITQTEINRFAYSYNYAAEQEVTVRLGDRDDLSDVVIGIVHRFPNDSRPGWWVEEYQDHPIQVKVVFYEKADWALVEPSTTSLDVPARSGTLYFGEATFDATFTIPADQPPGLYEGAITVDDGEHLTLIPTTVNVAVPSDELAFTFGGTERAGTPYDNGRTTGGWTWTWGHTYEEGDWRFFFYDADAGFAQQYLYVRNDWGDLCGNMPTAYETLVWGPNPGDQFSVLEPEKYGPYGMQYAGGTPFADYFNPYWWPNWGYPRIGTWWMDGDGTYQPENRAWATLWDGLNQVQFRNILNSGKIVCGEGFEATAGVFGVDAPESGIVIDTDKAAGSFELDVVSPVDGLMAYPYGFGEEQFFKNQVVPQGKHYELWPDDLLDGWVYIFEATNVDAIEIDTQGPGSSDIDLYLLYDANGDGIFNLTGENNQERVDYSYYGGSNEYIWYSGDFTSGYGVKDGTYAVVMYGYYVYPGDQFDLKLRLYGGDGLTIEGAGPENNYVLDVAAGEPETLMVNWEVPGPGTWNGFLVFMMPWEEEDTYWVMGPEIYVPVIINKEGIDVGVEKDVSQRVVEWGDMLTYTITVASVGAERAWMEVTDVLPQGLELIDDWDEWGYDGITSTLAAAAPWFFHYECDMWYDDWMRTVHYGCYLPVEYEGEFFTEDTITFKVRVEAQPGANFLNKADLKWYAFEANASGFLSDTAFSYVPLKVYMPLTLK